MIALTGWSRATMSQLYNGKQDYSPDILRQTAEALHVEPYELLMTPDRAMKLREAVADAKRFVRIVAEVSAANEPAQVKKFAKGE